MEEVQQIDFGEDEAFQVLEMSTVKGKGKVQSKSTSQGRGRGGVCHSFNKQGLPSHNLHHRLT